MGLGCGRARPDSQDLLRDLRHAALAERVRAAGPGRWCVREDRWRVLMRWCHAKVMWEPRVGMTDEPGWLAALRKLHM